jgi:hypothetical protein
VVLGFCEHWRREEEGEREREEERERERELRQSTSQAG